MRKAVMLLVVLVPVLLGLLFASERNPKRGLRKMLLAVFLFDAVFVFALYYVYLRLS